MSRKGVDIVQENGPRNSQNSQYGTCRLGLCLDCIQPLLDHLVSAGEQRRGEVEVQRLSGP